MIDSTRGLALAALAFGISLGCGGSKPTSTGGQVGGSGGSGSGGAACEPDTSAPNEVLPGTTDPAHGMFSMAEALAGLPPGPGPLRAVIETDLGTLTCTLLPDKAPNGVANFVGLARGLRPWLDPKLHHWVKRRFYDGLTFHRVIPLFVAQGGDPLGNGFGGPGYTFADEISDLKHVPGTLAYANTGPNTNGSQFYVTETAQPMLDGSYTIFGLCTPVSVVTLLTHVPTDANNKPLTPLHMKTVTITQCAP
jgi:peptidyl-prolyl cis-trans isomerase A (cyclophilin A)